MGRAALLQAIADKLIPGLNKSLRVLLVSQIEDGTRVTSDSEDETVLQHVVKGDKERMNAVEEFEGMFSISQSCCTVLKYRTVLTRAVESTKPSETQRILSEIRLARRRAELEEAQKTALRTSGARGKKAREEEIKAEDRVKEAEEV